MKGSSFPFNDFQVSQIRYLKSYEERGPGMEISKEICDRLRVRAVFLIATSVLMIA